MRATPPQIALLERLAVGPVDQSSLVGREHLSAEAILRLRWAMAVPVAEPAAKNGAGFYLAITMAGRSALAVAGEPRGTRRVGIRLPVAVQPHLDRGKDIHGTETAAIVSALRSSYPCARTPVSSDPVPGTAISSERHNPRWISLRNQKPRQQDSSDGWVIYADANGRLYFNLWNYNWSTSPQIQIVAWCPLPFWSVEGLAQQNDQAHGAAGGGNQPQTH